MGDGLHVDSRAEASARRKKRRKRKTKPRCQPARKRRARGSVSDSPYAVDAKRKRRKLRRRACSRKRRKPLRRAPVQPVPPPPVPPPPPEFRLSSPLAIYGGAFGVAQAERLLWRAGFGPSPGHAQWLAGMGLHRAVAALTRPEGPETFTGAAPTDGDGNPLAPEDLWGHDHLWFLDRMVRTNHPLVQRMTLVWHDWFATSNDGVGQQNLMLAQNELFRRHALGSFDTLVHDVTADPAMIVWLNLDQNTRWAPNENYARELMELFTLGADRGAYSEDDVRELARALTGWDSDWSDGIGYHNFRFVQSRHDATNKTVFGQTGNYRWEQAAAMCVRHPMHPSFFVTKLWSYFIPVPPSDGDRAALEMLYVSSGYQVRPLLEAILLHPQLHQGPRMVKPPAVFVAGMLRALRRAVDTDAWVWLMEGAGQRLFYPPDVAGWNDERWLDTSTVRGRWEIVGSGLYPRQLTDAQIEAWDPAETADTAVALARSFWGDPVLSAETVAVLTAYANAAVSGSLANWQQVWFRGLRQNALRHLLFFSPDLQTS